jgi:hypothetical protein
MTDIIVLASADAPPAPDVTNRGNIMLLRTACAIAAIVATFADPAAAKIG